MLNPKRLGVIILATLMTAPAWAADDTPANTDPDMPMMQHGGGMMMPGNMMPMMQPGSGMMMPGNMMPMMHSQMMPMMHPMGQGSGHGQAGFDHHGMHGMGHMMMYPQTMGGGMGYMMMNPQMMHMRIRHMHNMEQQLKKIEALLQQLVDQGKSG